ncbi:hypothetical protein CPB86DRAFT_742216, partial [Serendipita vermifera]
MTMHTVRAKAMVIAGKNVGVNWIYRFRKRHPEVKPASAKKRPSNRVRALNPTTVRDFYNKLIAELIENKIPVQNIFNADEEGI